jgi:DNA-binding transcriptional ArsR family regulator
MAEIDLIPPQKAVEVDFSTEPAYNAIASLSLLEWAEELTGLSEWVYCTVESLSPEQRRTNRLVLEDSAVHLGDASWSSFPAWLDDLAARDATAMRDEALEALRSKARKAVDGEIPSAADLLADPAAYLSLVECVPPSCPKTAGDTSVLEEAHALLNDPPARQDRFVTHLRAMWDEVLADEWERNLPELEASVAAFESLGLSGLTATEALDQVVLRKLTPQWAISWLAEVEQITFIPSAHTGPYLLRLGSLTESRERLVFGARIPQGIAAQSPALSRSELLMHLTALANDTRLRIVELLGQNGELNTPQIMAQLELSQSTAWRHLEHLTATGYTIMRTRGGAKCYRLNLDQVDHTFRALKEFCQ